MQMPGPDDPIDPELAAPFDRLAALTQARDATLADLRQLCDDDRLRVPPEVRNAVRGRLERVLSALCRPPVGYPTGRV